MATRKVSVDEIIGLQRYEQNREQHRQRIIAYKRDRRVSVGDQISFVFENHETVWFQVHEMLRAERIVDLDRIREEIDVYNELIPGDGELSATMLIEITDSARIRDDLVRFIGIDDSVWLEIDELRVPAEFEAGRSKEDKISAVQYVRFRFSPEARRAFVSGQGQARLVIDHASYRHAATLSPGVRASLAADLE